MRNPEGIHYDECLTQAAQLNGARVCDPLPTVPEAAGRVVRGPGGHGVYLPSFGGRIFWGGCCL